MFTEDNSINVSAKKEENLRASFLRHGLNPDRIMQFIESNLQTHREISELKKDSMTKIEYCHDQLVLNEVDILKQLLNE
jgi:hypothetical protein